MAEVCDRRVVAATPECAERAHGPEGLEENCGCVPRSFEPINGGGGPLTRQALRDGAADVADILSTSPSTADNDLVVLEDPGDNVIAQQIAQQMVPLTAEGRLPQEGAVDARSTTPPAPPETR